MSKNSDVVSASGQVISPGSGTIERVIVNTHSSGVISLTDSPGGASGRAIFGPYTLTAGAQVLPIFLDYSQGVYFTLVSGSASIQLGYAPTS